MVFLLPLFNTHLVIIFIHRYGGAYNMAGYGGPQGGGQGPPQGQGET